MVLSLPGTTSTRQIAISGMLFGARGGSCSCDPCDCNPCGCGDSVMPNPPLWRISGCRIEEGHVGTTNLSGLSILSLAQPREDGSWEEVLLVEKQATVEQIEALLLLFDDTLESFPAELGPLPRTQRAVYRIPLVYYPDATRPLLRVMFTQDQRVGVRTDNEENPPESAAWVYYGAVALREEFARFSQ